MSRKISYWSFAVYKEKVGQLNQKAHSQPFNLNRLVGWLLLKVYNINQQNFPTSKHFY